MTQPPKPARRVAFFGGSFVPPHRGHLEIARAAQLALQIETVLFAPVGAQPLKPQGSTAPFADRLAMTKLAIADEPGFAISLADAPLADGSHNYSVDTLTHLCEELGPNTQLLCLMGADSFLGLQKWHRGASIPFISPLIVASRPGQPLEDLARLLPAGVSLEPGSAHHQHPGGIALDTYGLRNSTGALAPFYILPGLQIEISASDIRRQASASLDSICGAHQLLPDPVCRYIAEHHLYQ